MSSSLAPCKCPPKSKPPSTHNNSLNKATTNHLKHMQHSRDGKIKVRIPSNTIKFNKVNRFKLQSLRHTLHHRA